MDLDDTGCLYLEPVGVRLGLRDNCLVCFDATTGKEILDSVEMEQVLLEEEKARHAAEDKARAEESARRAAEDKARAEESARHAAEDKTRAAEDRIRQLEERLRRLGSAGNSGTGG